jgi:hypothetical protein
VVVVMMMMMMIVHERDLGMRLTETTVRSLTEGFNPNYIQRFDFHQSREYATPPL